MVVVPRLFYCLLGCSDLLVLFYLNISLGSILPHFLDLRRQCQPICTEEKRVVMTRF